MSFVRLMLYYNEMISRDGAAPRTWAEGSHPPETDAHEIIAKYGQVRPNNHQTRRGLADGRELDNWEYRQERLWHDRCRVWKDLRRGAGIVKVVTEDPRPLWITIWGGAKTMAQALTDMARFVRRRRPGNSWPKLRVYSISDQGRRRAWIRREFPDRVLCCPSIDNDTAKSTLCDRDGIRR